MNLIDLEFSTGGHPVAQDINKNKQEQPDLEG